MHPIQDKVKVELLNAFPRDLYLARPHNHLIGQQKLDTAKGQSKTAISFQMPFAQRVAL